MCTAISPCAIPRRLAHGNRARHECRGSEVVRDRARSFRTIAALFGGLALLVWLQPARAAVDLSLVTEAPALALGQPVEVRIVATHDDPTDVQKISALSAVISWDPSTFRLLGIRNDGPVTWLVSGFLPDPDALNTTFDDGNAIYTALAIPGTSVDVSSAGLHVATLLFESLATTPPSLISPLLREGRFGRTQVFDGNAENVDVLGSLAGTSVTVVRCESADADSDGDHDLADFALLQACFSQETAATELCACLFDSDADEDADAADWLVFLEGFAGPGD